MSRVPADAHAGILVGVDIGGTFTDVVVVLPEGRIVSAKVPSTPEDFSRGIHDGLVRLFADADGLRAVTHLHHGTTVATNCVLERRGAPAALMTTEGFRDVLEIGRVRVPVLYDLQYEKSPAVIERAWRLEVDERIGARGEVIRPLSLDSLPAMIETMRRGGIESVAVCLLNSYVNPDHERAIGAALAQAGLHYTLSSDLLREHGEYERTSTAVLNAYLMPVVSEYLERLRTRLAQLDFNGELMVMGSSGGLMRLADASARPAFLIESGPAAGVIAAQAIGRVSGYPNLIAFDMGGTTAKASIIEEGQISQSPELEVGSGISYGRKLIGGGGYPVRATVIDLAEVGAGGGSIVWFDAAGGMHVGPQSTGADPGPACYGRGGILPTVTDACAVLGYLGASLAGGGVTIDVAQAEQALVTQLGSRLKRPAHEIAYGIYEIACANMMRAVRAVSIERGRDPQDFTLIAFGGNGGLFAPGLARAMQMKRIVVPPLAGLFSVIGLLAADARHHQVVDIRRPLDAFEAGELQRRIAVEEADFLARQSPSETEAVAARRIELSVDMRYAGQSHALTVPLAAAQADAAMHRSLAEAFHATHQKIYGHHAAGERVELLNLRLTMVEHAGIAPERLAQMARAAHAQEPAETPATSRRAWFGASAGWHTTTVLRHRAALAEAGSAGTPGPIIIEEYDATILVPPGWMAHLDAFRNVVLEDVSGGEGTQGRQHG